MFSYIRSFLCLSMTAIIFLGLVGCAEAVTGVWTEIYSHNTAAEVDVQIEEAEIEEIHEPIDDIATASVSVNGYEDLDVEIYDMLAYEDDDAEVAEDTYKADIAQETEFNITAARPTPHQSDSGRQLVALTFDDGPIQYTEYILDILERYGGRVTFCVLGYRVETWASTVLRAVSLGNEVVGHSWDHPNFTMISEDDIVEQILFTSAAIEAAMGAAPPRLFRAPYGRVNDEVVNVAERLGYAMLHWSVDPRDWERRDPERIYNYITENAVHGAIFILHDIRPTTMEAMEKVVPALIEQGFELVTASELIEYVYGGIVQGEVYKGLS